MDKKYLRPAREQLLWLPVFLTCVSIICTGVAYFLHQKMPEYTLKYMTYYNYGIWRFSSLYLLTAFAIGYYIYVRNLPRAIIEQGECYSGHIQEIVWRRSLLNWCEWKCQLVIQTNYWQEYRSPYYRYDFLNYLIGTDCQVHVWKNQCYITDFQTSERKMTKIEKKYGVFGGGFWDAKNFTPEFPVLDSVLTTDKFWRKSYRSATQISILCILLVLFLCVVTSNTLSLFEPRFKDSDGDGMKDVEEFSIGTDPTVYDELFFFVTKDEMNGVKLEYKVEVPAPCDYYTATYRMYAKFIQQPITRVETIPGYIVHPFYIVNESNCVNAEVTLEFDKALLSKPHFYPQIFRFSFDHQEEGMISVPFIWDGKSNVVHMDALLAGELGRDWEYYFLDGYEWQQWYDNY